MYIYIYICIYTYIYIYIRTKREENEEVEWQLIIPEARSSKYELWEEIRLANIYILIPLYGVSNTVLINQYIKGH